MPTLNLTAKLGVDGRGFKAGLKEAEVAGNRFAGNLKAQLGAIFTVAAVTGFAKGVSDTVGRIKDLSDQYQVTTAEVQKSDVALKKNGLQFEQLGAAILKMGQARRQAVEGNQELRDTFARYGVTLRDLNDPQLRNFDILMKISKATAGANITAREQVELTDLLGERAGKLVSTLGSLGQFEGIKIFSDRDIQRIDDATKKLAEFKRQLTIMAAENLLEVPNLRWRDFAASLFTPEFLEKIGFDAGATPGADVGPLTKEEIEAGNAAKRKRLAEAAEASGDTLFEQDKNRKQTSVKAAVRSAAGKGNSIIGAASGFAAVGGFSGGLTNFDPSLFVEQGQLRELQAIHAEISKLYGAVARGGGRNSNGSAFRR